MANVSILSILVGVAVSGMLPAPHDQPDFEAAFEQLKTLVGEWEGEEQIVSYYLTGNGSALVEDLYRGSRHPSVGFTSVYHMDGDSLRPRAPQPTPFARLHEEVDILCGTNEACLDDGHAPDDYVLCPFPIESSAQLDEIS